ncbi:MAG: hypothetical protein ACOCX6_02580, partial [bacterium]
GCSVVFTASINGSTIDREAWEEEETTAGIADVIVYLYTDELQWTIDYSRYTENDLLPDELSPGEDPRYFASTVTGADGSFSFNGLIWNQLFPQYGKSGDRREVYFLFYNRNYGFAQNDVPAFVVSDVTNRLPPFRLRRITNSAGIEGQVVDSSTGEGVNAVNIGIYVATSLAPNVYPDEPDYTTITGIDGNYGVNISFHRDLGDSTAVRITARRNNYNCDAYDGEPLSDSLEESPVEKDTTYTASDIEIIPIILTVEGQLRDVIGDPDTGMDGEILWLFYDNPGILGPGTSPQDITSTFARPVGVEDLQNGYFIFTEIDTEEPEVADENKIWLYQPEADEITAGQLDGIGGAIDEYTLQFFGENWVVIDND